VTFLFFLVDSCSPVVTSSLYLSFPGCDVPFFGADESFHFSRCGLHVFFPFFQREFVAMPLPSFFMPAAVLDLSLPLFLFVGRGRRPSPLYPVIAFPFSPESVRVFRLFRPLLDSQTAFFATGARRFSVAYVLMGQEWCAPFLSPPLCE